MLAEEESLKVRLIKSTGNCQRELAVSCSDLHVEPFQEEGELTVLQLEKDLHTQGELRPRQEQERKPELKLLVEQDQELCEVLCTPHYDSDSVPSLEELNQFRQHLSTLRATQASWHEELINTQRQIPLRMEELDHTPDTNFEREAVCEDEMPFGQRPKFRERFANANHEEIETKPVELAKYWDRCFYSQDQRQAFAAYYGEDYTGSLLQVHDIKVVPLRNYYEIHKELLEGVQKREESWRLFFKFERKPSDPSRFTNRRGNLLKEEKQQPRLQKTLSKLEEELEAQIEMWEQKHSTSLVVHGQKSMEYVTVQWEMHQLEKEQDRQERQLKNKQQKETEMVYGALTEHPTSGVLAVLCSELHVEPFKEEGELTILQPEKDLHTQGELRPKQEQERKRELKPLVKQNQELCEVLCMSHYDSDSIPSLEELNQFR
uniref:Uncharacterized protein n=1 Tax=Pipistrellus kuhlii TaxID=59472 RepID=A0A7J8AAP9_PIPKU|nr:hypothetical protein mPipKuh1_014032 [Pipistrellus kuhlii]